MRYIGVVLLVVGMGLGYWGYDLSGSLSSQLNEAFNGSPTDKVMWLYIGGAASFVLGLLFVFRK